MAKKTMSTKLTKAELVFNEDGTITVNDVTTLQFYLAKIIKRF